MPYTDNIENHIDRAIGCRVSYGKSKGVILMDDPNMPAGGQQPVVDPNAPVKPVTEDQNPEGPNEVPAQPEQPTGPDSEEKKPEGDTTPTAPAV